MIRDLEARKTRRKITVPGAGWLIRADEGSRGSARDTGFTVRGKEPPLYDSSKSASRTAANGLIAVARLQTATAIEQRATARCDTRSGNESNP